MILRKYPLEYFSILSMPECSWPRLFRACNDRADPYALKTSQENVYNQHQNKTAFRAFRANYFIVIFTTEFFF
jgi:hypothetical protein